MKKVINLLAVLVLSISATYAQACMHNGVEYPEGTIIGPYVCSGGTWVQR